jgi:hypothetical protein
MMKKRPQEAEEIFSGYFPLGEEEDLWIRGRLSQEEVLSQEGLSIFCLILRPDHPGPAEGPFPPYSFHEGP